MLVPSPWCLCEGKLNISHGEIEETCHHRANDLDLQRLTGTGH